MLGMKAKQTTDCDWLAEADALRRKVSEMVQSTRPLHLAANEAAAELDALHATLLAANETIESYRYDEASTITDDEFAAAVATITATQIKIDRLRPVVDKRRQAANAHGTNIAYQINGMKRALRKRFDEYQQRELRRFVDTMDGRGES